VILTGLNDKIHFSTVSIKYIVNMDAFLCNWSILECFNICERAETISLQTAQLPLLEMSRNIFDLHNFQTWYWASCRC